MVLRKLVFKRIDNIETCTGLISEGENNIYFTISNRKLILFDKNGMIIKSPHIEQQLYESMNRRSTTRVC